jgi:hypothetical protein
MSLAGMMEITGVTQKTMCPSEHDIQASIFEWSLWMAGKYPELQMLNGSLNGVRLTIGQAVKAKRAGMKKGFPDIFLPIPRGKYHGLFIELKKPGSYPTPEQKLWVKALRGQNYFADILVGGSFTESVIVRYLELGQGEEIPFTWEG